MNELKIALRAGLSVLAALACGGAAAQAGPAPKPSPKVGDVTEFADLFVTVPCKRWEVKEVNNKDGMQVSQCGGNLAYFEAATGALVRIVTQAGDKLVQFTPRSTGIEFPLSVGKTWSGSYDGYTNDDGASWNAKSKCSVKGEEKLTVKAGEFDTLRIECEDAWSSGPFSGVSKTTSWYSPKVGMVVKASDPEAAKWNYELTGFQSK